MTDESTRTGLAKGHEHTTATKPSHRKKGLCIVLALWIWISHSCFPANNPCKSHDNDHQGGERFSHDQFTIRQKETWFLSDFDSLHFAEYISISPHGIDCKQSWCNNYCLHWWISVMILQRKGELYKHYIESYPTTGYKFFFFFFPIVILVYLNTA